MWDADLDNPKLPWVNSSKGLPSLVDFMLFALDPVGYNRGRAQRAQRRDLKQDLERSALYLVSQVAAFADRNMEEYSHLSIKSSIRIVGGKRQRVSREYVNTVVAGVAERLFEGKDPAETIPFLILSGHR